MNIFDTCSEAHWILVNLKLGKRNWGICGGTIITQKQLPVAPLKQLSTAPF